MGTCSIESKSVSSMSSLSDFKIDDLKNKGDTLLDQLIQLPCDSFMSAPVSDLNYLRQNAKTCMKSRMELFVCYIQASVCKKLKEFEPKKDFVVDCWKREEKGGGITCVIQDGSTFEKAGVSVSLVRGKLSKEAIQQMQSRGRVINTGASFFATGISSVVHPVNPRVPTFHFNYRYFEVEEENGNKIAWFGGGADLTPYYLDTQDVRHFHAVLRDTCNAYDPTYYKRFKKWCDDYFYIKFRDERRGVGGIFFDDLETPSIEGCFSFVAACAYSILPSYVPILERNYREKFSENEKIWQQLRRGRYVEFNLVYDRGTKFGLYTPGARVESILMSLPLLARWEYMQEPIRGSKEYEMLEVLKEPRDWLTEKNQP